MANEILAKIQAASIKDKIRVLTDGKSEHMSYYEITNYIWDHCSHWQYNGVAAFDDIALWCEQTFGNNWAWSFETIYFKNERDRTLFLLRWS